MPAPAPGDQAEHWQTPKIFLAAAAVKVHLSQLTGKPTKDPLSAFQALFIGATQSSKSRQAARQAALIHLHKQIH